MVNGKTIAMIFPGQGSQLVGMGRELVDASPAAASIFQRAEALLGDSLGLPISQLCFEGPEDKLRLTIYTQPALFTVSAAALAVLRDEGIDPAIVAGHSVGEYAALYAAGVFDFETGLSLVRARAQAMYDAGQRQPGAMAAVLNLDSARVREICDQVSSRGELGVVVPANWNCPGQIVISGDTAAVEAAGDLVASETRGRFVSLPVSGAFHSPLVRPAVDVMRRELADAQLSPPRCKFVANVSARLVDDVESIREGLAQQIDSCVLWESSVRLMADHGADLFLEVGPGKVLTGMLRRIDRNLTGANFATPEDLQRLPVSV